MQVIIPPAIRRIMQAYPPVEPLALTPPLPPPSPPPLNFLLVVGQLLLVFVVCGVILRFSQWLGGILLAIGLVAIVIQVMVRLRQQLRPNRRQEEEYIQALAVYAQAEKAHQEKIQREHTPQKIAAYRRQQLAELRQKTDRLSFSATPQPLPPWLQKLQESKTDGHWFYLPALTVPGLDRSYTPQCLYQSEDKMITIVIDYADTDQSFIRDFFSQQGIIWILATPTELQSPKLQEELEQIWASLS